MIDLSMVISAIVAMSVESTWEKGKRNEVVLRLLKRFKLDTNNPLTDFDSIYACTLIEYGVFRHEMLLNFFRNEFVRQAFHESFYKADPNILDKEAEGIIEWNEETSKLGKIDYDPRREFVAFSTVFHEIIDRTRTPAEVKRDQKLSAIHNDLQEKMGDIIESLDRLEALGEIRAARIRIIHDKAMYSLHQSDEQSTIVFEQPNLLPQTLGKLNSDLEISHAKEILSTMNNSNIIDSLFTKNIQEIVQALLSYQLPWGEWGDIGSEERLKRGERPSYIGIQDIILKPNVARSMFAVIQLKKIDLKRFNYRYIKCFEWMNKEKTDGWFHEWRLGQSYSSETNIPDINKSPDIRHTAQVGTTTILLDKFNLPLIRILENILNNQLLSGAWSNDPNQGKEALFATAYCIEFIYNILKAEEEFIKFIGNNLIGRCRYSLDKGIAWLYNETNIFNGYFGSEKKASSYLTSMVILRVHRPLFERYPELRMTIIENLLRNNESGTWIDERHTEAHYREISRYPTTIRVLDLLTQIYSDCIIEESVVQEGYKYIADSYHRDISEPPDLALLLESLINIKGLTTIRSLVDENQLYDSWTGESALLTSEFNWISQYYADWRQRSNIRVSAIENGLYHHCNGYDVALQEEKFHIEGIDAMFERIKKVSKQ